MTDLQMDRGKSKSQLLSSYHEELVRQLMMQFYELDIDGTFFGQETNIRLPKFDSVSRLLLPDGSREIDAVGQKANSEYWVVEVKWRSRRCGVEEMKKLMTVDGVIDLATKEKVFWLVSRSGFTVEAKDFARKNQIYLTDESDLIRLIQFFGLDYEG